MWRGLVLLTALLAGCGNLGADFPTCDVSAELPVSIVISLQSVPTADKAPCIHELRPGWNYHDLRAERGRANFTLDSDRLGDSFVRVELVPSCDPGAAEQQGPPVGGVTRFIEVSVDNVEAVPLALITAGPTAFPAAAAAGVDLAAATVNGRSLQIAVDDRPGDPEERVAAAVAAGRIAVVVTGDEGAARFTVHGRGGETTEVDTAGDVVDIVADMVGKTRYRARWYHLFEGGCITYDVDARGAAATTVRVDLIDALGFYPVGELRSAVEGGG